jgi:thiol-disulfide isomerase/thioredoxin
MKNGVTIFWGLLVLVVAGLIGASFMVNSGPSKYDGFAQCLKDKGAVMYGAFWCPHCQATKRMFGSAAQYLPYVECSTPDGQSQLAVCKDKGIQSYPTWTFVGTTTTLTGEHTMQEFASFSGCALPQ